MLCCFYVPAMRHCLWHRSSQSIPMVQPRIYVPSPKPDAPAATNGQTVNHSETKPFHSRESNSSKICISSHLILASSYSPVHWFSDSPAPGCYTVLRSIKGPYVPLLGDLGSLTPPFLGISLLTHSLMLPSPSHQTTFFLFAHHVTPS